MKRRKSKNHWTLWRLQFEANKYTNRTDFKNGSSGAYQFARRRNWLDMICGHMTDTTVKKRWDFKSSMEAAKYYATREDMAKDAPGAYRWLERNGYLPTVFGYPHSRSRLQNATHRIALKHASVLAFATRDKEAYTLARDNGWLETVCNHMK